MKDGLQNGFLGFVCGVIIAVVVMFVLNGSYDQGYEEGYQDGIDNASAEFIENLKINEYTMRGIVLPIGSEEFECECMINACRRKDV